MDYDLTAFNVQDNKSTRAVPIKVEVCTEGGHNSDDMHVISDGQDEIKVKEEVPNDAETKQEATHGVETKLEVSDNENKSTNTKKNNFESKSIDEDEPKPKKGRYQVKPELAHKVYEKMVDELVGSYVIGLKEVPVDTVASTVGYKNPRSDAIYAAVKVARETGVFTKTKGVFRLTDQGIQNHVPKEIPPANPEEALEKFWMQLEKKLSSGAKSKGKAIRTAAFLVWNLLKDGKSHDMANVLSVTGYKGRNSTGFEQVIKALKELKFIEKGDNKVSFTDKLFPFGRPA